MGYQPGDRPFRGSFHVLEEYLGQGAFGEVWRARAPGRVKVAVKILDLRRSQGEIEYRNLEWFVAIKHTNLITVQAFWVVDDDANPIDDDAPEPAPPKGKEGPSGARRRSILPALRAFRRRGAAPEKAPAKVAGEPSRLVVVMDLGKKCLQKRLRECVPEDEPGGLPVEELLHYMEGAAEGIDFLHKPIHDLGGDKEVAIVHRDIKPANILVVGNSAAVCDFGVAKVEDLWKSRTGTLAGTYYYMAPEVLAYRPADARSDQYSLAITYFQLRTNRFPFGSGSSPNPAEWHDALYSGQMDLSGISEGEQKVIARATSRQPQDRYPSCLEMVDELKGAYPRRVQRKPTPDPETSLTELLPGHAPPPTVTSPPETTIEPPPTPSLPEADVPPTQFVPSKTQVVADETLVPHPDAPPTPPPAPQAPKTGVAPDKTIAAETAAPEAPFPESVEVASPGAGSAVPPPSTGAGGPEPDVNGTMMVPSKGVTVADAKKAPPTGWDQFPDTLKPPGVTQPGPAPPKRPEPERVVPPPRRRTRLWVAAIVVVAFGGLLGFDLLRDNSWFLGLFGRSVSKKENGGEHPPGEMETLVGAAESAIANRRFVDAKESLLSVVKKLEDPSGDISPTHRERTGRICRQLFQGLLEDQRFQEALDLADAFPDSLIGSKPELEREASGAWLAHFNKRLETQQFPEALASARQPPHFVATSTEDLEATVSRRWLDHVTHLGRESRDTRNAKSQCISLLAGFPTLVDAHLVCARICVKASDYDDAREHLASFVEGRDPKQIPKSQCALYSALQILVTADEDPENLETAGDDFVRYDAHVDDADEDWRPLASEVSEIPRLRDKFLWGRVSEASVALENEAKLPLEERDYQSLREQWDLAETVAENSAEESLKAQLQFCGIRIRLLDPDSAVDEVDRALEAAEGLLPDLGKDQHRDLSKDLGNLVVKENDDTTLARLYGDAAKLLGKIRERDKIIKEPVEALAAISEKWVPLRVKASEPVPDDSALLDLWSVVTESARRDGGAVRERWVYPWVAECLLELGDGAASAGSPSPETVRRALELAEAALAGLPGAAATESDADAEYDRYVRYVYARAAVLGENPQYSTVVNELGAVFRGLPQPADDPILRVGRRLHKTFSIAVEAAVKAHPQDTSSRSVFTWLASVDDSARADAQNRQLLLLTVQKLQPQLKAAQQSQLQAHLALDSFLIDYRPDPDTPPEQFSGADETWSRISAALTAEPEGEALLSDSAFPARIPLCYLCALSYSGRRQDLPVTPQQQLLLLKACTELIAHEARVGNDEDAARLCEEAVVRPLAGARDWKASLRQDPNAARALVDFFAAVGEWIWARNYLDWKFEKGDLETAAMVEGLLTDAIDLSGDTPSGLATGARRARWHLTRARARLRLPSPKLDEAEADAAAASDLFRVSAEPEGDSLCRISGLRSDVLLRKSRSQALIENRLEYLRNARTEADKALADPLPGDEAKALPPHDPERSDAWLTRSFALVELANYTPFEEDPDYSIRVGDLEQSVLDGNHAKEIERERPYEPHLALGNAYEDLAWLAEENQETNFRLAITAFERAFSESKKDSVRGRVKLSQGRCYYRILEYNHQVDPDLDLGAILPANLQGKEMAEHSREALTAAIEYLEKAQGREHLLAEAYRFRSKLNRLQGMSAETDADRAKAQEYESAAQSDSPVSGKSQALNDARALFGKQSYREALDRLEEVVPDIRQASQSDADLLVLMVDCLLTMKSREDLEKLIAIQDRAIHLYNAQPKHFMAEVLVVVGCGHYRVYNEVYFDRIDELSKAGGNLGALRTESERHLLDAVRLVSQAIQLDPLRYRKDQRYLYFEEARTNGRLPLLRELHETAKKYYASYGLDDTRGLLEVKDLMIKALDAAAGIEQGRVKQDLITESDEVNKELEALRNPEETTSARATATSAAAAS
ncbi:MAG: serine/threonine-protein kinase [Planctomycetota bacterium]